MDFSNVDPEIDLENIDWLEVKRIAKEHGDWYGNRLYSISEKKRLVNLWYLYAWFKNGGYEFYAACAVASVMWYASGYNGCIWGTGRCDSTEEIEGWTPHYPAPTQEIPEPDPDYWYTYRKAYPSNYATLQGSASAGTTNWHSLDWIVSPSLPESAHLATCPSYGISQWTPAITTIMRIMIDADNYYTGIGLHNGAWSRWWPDNTTLQLFGMDWQNYQSDITPPQNQYGNAYHAEWVHDQIVSGYSIPMTWTEFKNGKSAEEYTVILDKFHHSCYNWLTHYIQASTVAQMLADKNARELVFLTYIRPAFAAWDADGGAGLSDVPAPPGTFFTEGTWNDPLNAMLSSVILKKRGDKGVRTILL